MPPPAALPMRPSLIHKAITWKGRSRCCPPFPAASCGRKQGPPPMHQVLKASHQPCLEPRSSCHPVRATPATTQRHTPVNLPHVRRRLLCRPAGTGLLVQCARKRRQEIAKTGTVNLARRHLTNTALFLLTACRGTKNVSSDWRRDFIFSSSSVA